MKGRFSPASERFHPFHTLNIAAGSGGWQLLGTPGPLRTMFTPQWRQRVLK